LQDLLSLKILVDNLHNKRSGAEEPPSVSRQDLPLLQVQELGILLDAEI